LLFVLSQYWPFLVGALIAGIAVGFWAASPLWRRRADARTAGQKT
jgi:hypothetical protein